MTVSILDFLQQLFLLLPSLLWRIAAAWVTTFLILLFGFREAKKHLRPHLLQLDDKIREWAEGLRYRHNEADDEIDSGERIALTWFFRFWTNLASAPSLCFWSLAFPWWMYRQVSLTEIAPDRHSVALDFHSIRIWLLPGLCFAFSMALSYLLKRIFKRLRPPRKEGAFGHRMKDHSFPSGHSLTSLCFWAMLTVTACSAGLGLPATALLGIVAATVVLLTGLSRVYLGVHFPSDIMGGYIIGLLWSIACYVALRPALL